MSRGTVSDIVDRIDELVDASLSVGPVDDYNADRYDRCPHCSRHWHGLPVTERIAGMYLHGLFDEGYRVDEDDSRVLCRGSDFIGPMPAEHPWKVSVGQRQFPSVHEAINSAIRYAYETAAEFLGMAEWPEWLMPNTAETPRPQEISVQLANGQLMTGEVANVEIRGNETVVTFHQRPDANRYYGRGFSADYTTFERGPDVTDYVIDEARQIENQEN